jgi:hypothetical protein
MESIRLAFSTSDVMRTFMTRGKDVGFEVTLMAYYVLLYRDMYNKQRSMYSVAGN